MTFEFGLDSASIGKAIAELESYVASVPGRCKALRMVASTFVKVTAEREYDQAVGQINLSGYDNGDDGKDVYLRVEDLDEHSEVIVEGKDATFLEFGAGIFPNPVAVGQSPHPWGAGMGMLIGTYGQGQGANRTWSYGSVVTFGTPASMGLYTATLQLASSTRWLNDMVRVMFSD